MSGLDNLNSRLNYRGGIKQHDRLVSGKLEALKRALLYSYQAATAILADGREFRCLINPDKLKINYDDKIISIPFEDVCLNTGNKTKGEIENIGMKAGDVFTWKENNTDWIVYLQRLEEKAYFRAEIRKCEYSLDIGDNTYKVYARQRALSEIPWYTAKGISWNELDYGIEMYITKDDTTEDYFRRFKTITLDKKPWEVNAVDALSTEGIIRVLLKEDYSNTVAEEIAKEKEENIVVETSLIQGPIEVYPYDTVQYTIDKTGGS